MTKPAIETITEIRIEKLRRLANYATMPIVRETAKEQLQKLEGQKIDQDPFPNPEAARGKQSRQPQGARNRQGPRQKEKIFR